MSEKNNENPWVNLIYLSNENTYEPTKLWNEFQDVLKAVFNEGKREKRIEKRDIVKYLQNNNHKSDLFNAINLFRDGFVFREIHRPLGIILSGIIFDYDIIFSGAKFLFPISFSKAKFKENVFFSGCIFEWGTPFQNVIFKKYVSFERNKFLGCLDFSNSKFKSGTSFKESLFKESVNFSNSNFKCHADFTETNFKSSADFGGCIFKKGVDFEKSIFDDDAYFTVKYGMKEPLILDDDLINKSDKKNNFNIFKGNANFKSTTFTKNALFSGSNFKKIANFRDINTSPNSSAFKLVLRDAVFDKKPPEIMGTRLHEDTDFSGIKLPKTPQKNKKENLQNHINAYERLRIQADALGMSEAHLIFIRKELECRTKNATGFDWFLRFLYGFFSGYGTSILRPFLWLFGFWIFVNFCWFFYGYFCTKCAQEIDNFEIAGFNFSMIFPLSGLRNYYTESLKENITNAPDLLFFMSGALSVIGPIFLFLIGLALRNKFKLSL